MISSLIYQRLLPPRSPVFAGALPPPPDGADGGGDDGAGDDVDDRPPPLLPDEDDPDDPPYDGGLYRSSLRPDRAPLSGLGAERVVALVEDPLELRPLLLFTTLPRDPELTRPVGRVPEPVNPERDDPLPYAPDDPPRTLPCDRVAPKVRVVP